MKYAAYDNDGIITGFYDDNINHHYEQGAPILDKNNNIIGYNQFYFSDIPDQAIQITDEEWQNALSGGKKVDLVSKKLIDYTPTVSIDELKAKKLNDNNYNCQHRFDLGISYNGNLYDVDQIAKSNILLILQNAGESDTIPYLDFNFDVVNLSYAELKALSGAMIELTKNIYMRQKANADAISSADNLDALNTINIDYTTL